MKKLILFDLDGTLFDTTAAMEACGNDALSRLGLPTFPRAQYALFSGGGIEGYVKAILSAAGDRDFRHYDAFWSLYLKKQETLEEESNVPYPGVFSLIGALKEAGIRLAVLSNKDHETCVEIVERIFGAELFDMILGDQGLRPAKPDPAGVFKILSDLQVDAADALYVGDTEVDIETGRNADLDTVAALWGYRSRETLVKAGARLFAEAPEDILTLALQER
ncbi:MAG: HAD family hydrolase [Clostridia bacterium]|nr:HAD family hydrolase [Clostridia bacterium]